MWVELFMYRIRGVTVGWLLCLVTGAPLVGGPTTRGPDKRRKGLRGPRPEKVTGASDGSVMPLYRMAYDCVLYNVISC